MTFRYPQGPDDDTVLPHSRQQFSRVHKAWGAGDPDVVFGGSPVSPTPWPRAARSRQRFDYDQDLVNETLRHPEANPTVDVDPRFLHATQPNVTRDATNYYLGDEYERTGITYADMEQAGNRLPFVYDREDGQSLILSGHHRAAAALLQGRQFPARRITGPWGRPR